MQARIEANLSSDFQVEFAEAVARISDDFTLEMHLNGSDGDEKEKSLQSEEKVGDESADEDFSFVCVSDYASANLPGDVFQDGQIKPVFPLFDQSLLHAGGLVLSKDDLPQWPPVKSVFVEAEDSERAEGEIAGPYCAWSGKAVEASPEVCKKSNSTGFCKLWRFRDLLNRSNSDGRDAFVFLNGSATTSSNGDEKNEDSWEKMTAGEAKANGGGGKAKATVKKGGKGKTATVKKGGKVKTATLSAHELHYVRNRALREEDRRRSFLPYRPEVVGFFTRVQGGLSKNLHPY